MPFTTFLRIVPSGAIAAACWTAALSLTPPCTIAAEAHSTAAKLQRLGASPLLLQPPPGLKGDFDVASTPPSIDFAIFPGQKEGARLWSSWGDCLFAGDGKFYASIGDHDAPHGTAYVYCIDPQAQQVRLVVDYNKAAGIPDNEQTYSPGKIHGALVQASDGGIYFFGYRGSVRRTGEETGYKGDWLLRYDPLSDRTENLGIAVPYSSVPVLRYSPRTNSLYGLSVPGATMPNPTSQFFRYDLKQRALTFIAPIAERGPRAMILAEDGRAWFGNGNGGLHRYDPKANQMETTDIALPGDGTLRAASRPDAKGTAYCFSKDGVVFAFDTSRETVREITSAFVQQPLYTATCRLDPSGRYLYYVPGAHGKSSRSGTPVIQLDVTTGRRKVLAFLNTFIRQEMNYNLGGTYGLALNEDGSQLCISFNGSRLPAGRQPDFGLCSVLVLNIPASERLVR